MRSRRRWISVSAATMIASGGLALAVGQSTGPSLSPSGVETVHPGGCAGGAEPRMTARVVADSENGLGIYLESHDLDDVILSGLVEVNQSNGESLRRWKISPARVKLSETPRFDALDARGLKNDIYTLRIRLAGVDATDRNKGPESLWIEEHVRVQDTIPTLLSDDEWLTVSDSLAQR